MAADVASNLKDGGEADAQIEVDTHATMAADLASNLKERSSERNYRTSRPMAAKVVYCDMLLSL